MKTAIFESSIYEKEYFKEHLKGDNITYFDGPLEEKNAIDAKSTELIVIFVHSKISQKTLKKMPKLKYIITRSVGYEHIDLKACKKREISVFNIADYGTQTVAEHTFAIMLALVRRLHEAINSTKLGSFSTEGFQGRELMGKTLGVIGAGRIGQEVIKRAKAFGMEVVVYSQPEQKELAKDMGFEYLSLNNLLKRADIITIHAPLTNETKHIINKKTISLVKHGAYLINTSRGGIVEGEALLEALDKGIIEGAALDVLEGETEIQEEHELLRKGMNKDEANLLATDHVLIKHPKVIVTPHIAFYTKEALERIVEKTCKLVLQCKNRDVTGAINI